MSLAGSYDALFFDLDGTIWAGHEAIPGAAEAVAVAKERGVETAYITNNASKGPDEVAAQLRAIGISAEDSDVLTSAQAAVQLAAQHVQPGDPVLVVGADSFVELVRAAGFRPVTSADEKPVAVVHGHSPDNGWRQLSEAALAIRAGATYLASNLDTTLPADRGLMVGNGSMVAAVTSATRVVPQAAGKPGPAMFELAQKNLGVHRPLAVGDRLDTDIAGGVAAGMETLHVLTGVSGPLDLIAAVPEQRPTFVAESLAVLFDETISPDSLRPGAQGGFVARAEIDGEGVVVVTLGGGDDSATPVEALRTVLAAVWAVESESSAAPRIIAESDAARRAVATWW